MDEIDEKIKATVEERKKEDKEKVVGELKKMPIVSVACDRASISRDTYYRWHREDSGFAVVADEAMRDGERLMCDMGESQIVSLMRDKHFPAIMAYLRSHHPRYANKLELEGRIEHVEKRKMTPEEKALLEKSLRLAMPHIEGAEEIPEKSAEQPAPNDDDTNTNDHESKS